MEKIERISYKELADNLETQLREGLKLNTGPLITLDYDPPVSDQIAIVALSSKQVGPFRVLMDFDVNAGGSGDGTYANVDDYSVASPTLRLSIEDDNSPDPLLHQRMLGMSYRIFDDLWSSILATGYFRNTAIQSDNPGIEARFEESVDLKGEGIVDLVNTINQKRY